MGSCREGEMQRHRKGTPGLPRQPSLRAIVWTALLASFGLTLAGSASAIVTLTWPAETADATLVDENQSWSRYLHDALRLPAWLDL